MALLPLSSGDTHLSHDDLLGGEQESLPSIFYTMVYMASASVTVHSLYFLLRPDLAWVTSFFLSLFSHGLQSSLSYRDCFFVWCGRFLCVCVCLHVDISERSWEIPLVEVGGQRGGGWETKIFLHHEAM